MLVLTRKAGESLRIGTEIRVTVVSMPGGQVRLAIEAPDHIAIHREEVLERIARENREAARSAASEDASSSNRPNQETRA